MISIGLTGNVAAGKSAVADAWEEAGIPVVRADQLARVAVAPGSPGLDEIRAEFGGEVLSEDGSLDRAAMREIVFRNDDARHRLEAIVHPRVWTLRSAWLDERRAGGATLVAAEIPLLFETGRERAFDAVVFVDAPEEERIRRIVEHRGLEVSEARRIVAKQGTTEPKRVASDHVIDNRGSLDELRSAAVDLLPTLSDPPTMRMDLHMHTWGSWDCLSDPEALLSLGRERGMERIAITDHDVVDVAFEMHARYPQYVIPGEEVKTAEGIDLIGHYLTELIPRGTPAAEVADRVREQGGVVYLPHPYAKGKGGGGRFAEAFADFSDVVEVFNARLHPTRQRNDPAEDLAQRRGLLRGAGSDAHTVGEVANAWVEVPKHANHAGAFARALRRARVHGVEASRLVHLGSTWAKVRKRLPGRWPPLDSRTSDPPSVSDDPRGTV